MAGDASAMPAHQALTLATLNGARALGMESLIGSLEVGKYADLTAVDLSEINTQPVHNPLSHLVYASQASQVSHVWCGGRLLYGDSQLKTIDLVRVRKQAEDWQQAIAQV